MIDSNAKLRSIQMPFCTLAGLRLPEMQEGRACGAALPARHGVRHFSVMSFLLF